MSNPSAPDREVVLSVRDLEVSFASKRGRASVVRGLDYDVHRGETLAIVGESGSGKSVSTLALTKLIPMPPGRVTGTAHLGGEDLLAMSERELLRVRGRRVGFVFQDPMTSLNPVHPIGRQLVEGMRHHLGLSEAQGRDRAVELLRLVGIPAAEKRLDDYPHQFSGGMRQRVVIAIGLSCDPQVLIADEATTALDVTTQAQITELVGRLQQELGMAVIWITHDLGVVAGIADRVLVMYAGEIVEEARVDELFADPRHPYTVGLLRSLPVLGAFDRDELAAIPGLPPAPTDLPAGCAFHPRCGFRHDDRCATERPPLREVAPGHRIRSFYEVAEDERRAAATAGDDEQAPTSAGRDSEGVA
ncbi:ABC transporter ATP-binding protein [Egicoccus halophilus]|uniref:ABC transporter ATP-binding protein n=1 Tax=Egicoccus halophilus TaxID=1670830 RepID=A0A8J3A6X6_9ACTN|nr:ABC transporter ATP-binding protein [Egicoccus halophilus]GGI03052.1 ABC transporter ATP-binding protein [Egicoccus halophilus]